MDAGDSRHDAVARLALSRAELRALLEPDQHGSTYEHPAAGEFPRSRTMRLLTSRHGAGTLIALGAGLLLSRPAIALRLARIVPLGAVFRMIVLRFFTASGAKS